MGFRSFLAFWIGGAAIFSAPGVAAEGSWKPIYRPRRR